MAQIQQLVVLFSAHPTKYLLNSQLYPATFAKLQLLQNLLFNLILYSIKNDAFRVPEKRPIAESGNAIELQKWPLHFLLKHPFPIAKSENVIKIATEFVMCFVSIFVITFLRMKEIHEVRRICIQIIMSFNFDAKNQEQHYNS